MFFVSFADCCRQLGIDAKTLRRWLAQAQLPLQSHAGDGRKKGVSREHLQQLAALHHRSLPALASPAPAASEVACPLPANLLALPEQITALQQQVATLSHLLQQHVQEPAILPTPAQQPSTARPVPKPASSAARSRPVASATVKTPAKPTHVLARVEYVREGHYVVICPKRGLLPFEPDSPAWFAWLARESSFRFVGKHGRFTAHCDAPRGTRIAWRAHRNIRNHTYNQRLGRTNELTIALLEQAAAAFQAHLK